MKPESLALKAASFYGGVRHKRYSVQQEIAPLKKSVQHSDLLYFKTADLCIFKTAI